jgi:signal transduction histidine kinase
LQYATADIRQKEVEQVSLRALLDEVIANLGPALTESGAEIDYVALPTISGYPARLLQLFQNLISNAVKYRRPGVPQIRIAAERDRSGWLIRVKDNGLGIEPRYAERIFAPLQRLHGPEISGTGLGLAICKRIVESEGGTIWVDSEPGRGSMFCFTLPDK